MTLQEMFNKAYLGLAGQKFERSANKQGSCLYRSPDGKKCAVGHLISDEHYASHLESKSVFSWDVNQALTASGVDLIDRGIADVTSEAEQVLNECQQCHDNSVSPEDMQQLLQKVAAAHNLTVPELP